MVQLFLFSILLCSRIRFDTFKIPIFHRPFRNAENVLSTKGTAKAEQNVVQLFLLSVLLRYRNGFDTFKI